ncbi:MAG: winged helix-turn-helix domain-containing protein [Desulfarculus sp.]|nr:winged helix-turn-helix domain-containing protein [Desulfarculus sp.]
MPEFDWRDPKCYEYTKSHTCYQWAWEFLRRNPEYKADWEKELPEGLARIKRDTPDRCPIDHPCFVLTMESPKYVKKWGLYHLLNPATAEPLAISSHWFSGDDHLLFYRGRGVGLLEMLEGKGTPEEHVVRIPEGHMAVVFDLREPLESQFEVAKENIRRWQAHWLRKTKSMLPTFKVTRDHERLLLYIRVLDALQDNPDVTPTELARILGLNSLQHAESTKKSAINMRDGGYKKLLIARPRTFTK